MILYFNHTYNECSTLVLYGVGWVSLVLVMQGNAREGFHIKEGCLGTLIRSDLLQELHDYVDPD